MKESASPATIEAQPDRDDLPEGWTLASTADLFTFVTSGSRGWAKYYAHDGALFLRIANLDHDTITIDFSEKKFVQPPSSSEGKRTRVQIRDLLVSITADVGMIGLVTEDFGEAYINQHIALARPSQWLDDRYLAWYITSRKGQDQLRELQRGATKVGLGLDDIQSIDIPLAPIDEQHRIVRELEKLFAQVHHCRARLAKVPTILKVFRQSVLAAACSGRLTEDSSNGESWREQSLDDVADIKTGPFGSTLHRSDYVSGGVPVINPVNIVAGTIVPSAEITVDPPTYRRLQEYALEDGDIIIARRGEMGRCATVGSRELGWLCGTGSAIIRPKSGVVPRFLQLIISSPPVRAYLSDASVGSTMDNLNQRVFKALPLSLPNVTEQHETVCRVEALFKLADKIEERVAVATRRADKLTQSILAKAFRGELVPTEAELARKEGRDYETASALLERIKSDREESTASPNGTNRRHSTAGKK